MPQTCRFCAAPLSHVVVDLGVSPLCESFLRPEDARRDGALLPAAGRWSASECFLVQLPAYVAPDDIFVEYAYFSSFSDSWLEHARGTPSGCDASSHLGPRRPGRRAGQQRRLPAAELRRGRDPRPRHRAGPERGRGRRSRRSHDPAASSSASPSPSELTSDRPPGRPHRLQQHAGPDPGPQRLRGRDGGAACTDGPAHDRGPASAAPPRGQPVRHDLPRALLVLLARRRSTGS